MCSTNSPKEALAPRAPLTRPARGHAIEQKPSRRPIRPSRRFSGRMVGKPYLGITFPLARDLAGIRTQPIKVVSAIGLLSPIDRAFDNTLA